MGNTTKAAALVAKDELGGTIGAPVPQLHEHHYEQSRHGELDPGGVERYNRECQGSDDGSQDPVELIEQRDRQQELLFVHVLGDPGGAHQRVRLIGHPEYEVPALPAEAVVPVHQRQAVEDVPDVHHHGEEHGLQYRHPGDEEVRRQVLSGSGVHDDAHQHRPQDVVSLVREHNAEGCAYEQISCEHRDGVGESPDDRLSVAAHGVHGTRRRWDSHILR